MNRTLLLLLVLLAALVGGLLWTAGTGDAPRDEPQAPPSTAATPDAPRRDAAPVARPAAAAAIEASVPVNVAEEAEATPARSEAATAYEKELAAGVWVEGRVILPEGTPLNEIVEVVAKGKKFEHGPHHRVRVAGDGGFRVAFQEKTRTARLDVEGRWVYLDQPLKLKVADGVAQDADDVVLEPKLGGCVTGRIVLPENPPVAVEELLETRIQLDGMVQTGGGNWDHARRAVQVEEDLSFEIGGLAPHLQYDLHADPGPLVPAQHDDFHVTAGEDTIVDLEFLVGVEVAGVVVDEHGEPQPEVQVRAESDHTQRGVWIRGSWRDVETDEEGAFRLRGIFPGKITVSAESKGYEDAILELGGLADRHVENGVELVLRGGNFVAGRVLWPDGNPAEKGFVQVEEPDPDDPRQFHYANDDDHRFRVEADGTFRATGLGEGPYRVIATAVRTDEYVDEKGRTRKKRTTWRARADDVAANDGGLELLLGAGLRLDGRVVDDTGAPVERFRIEADRIEGNEMTWWRSTQDVERSFKDPNGEFALEGLEQGRWRMSVDAKGYARSQEVVLRVPEELAPRTFVVPRAATLSGIVRDPSGAPVAEAIVIASSRSSSVPYYWGFQDDEGEQTDDQGLFEIEDVPTGTVVVVARSTAHADSADLVLELAPGQVVSGLDLRLSLGGRITGEVRGADGRPAARRTVRVRNIGPGIGTTRSAQSDALGLFELAGLSAGRYEVETGPTDEEARDVLGRADENAYKLLESQVLVDVIDGETKHVVLAPPAVQPVRVHGRVFAGDEPLAGARMWLHSRAEDGNSRAVSTETDHDGGYEVTVPHPGVYQFQLSHRAGGGMNFSAQESVPAAASHHFDITFPVGSIAGRVYGPDGPLEGMQVSAAASMDGSWRHGNATTGRDGRYEIPMLPTGTYTVTAGRTFGPFSADSGFTNAKVEGVEVGPNARVTGIDLHLGEGAALEGIVRDAEGNPLEGAWVSLRDAEGRAIGVDGWPMSNEAGRYKISGIEPAEVRVHAVRGPLVSGESAAVVLRAGEIAKVDIVVEPGTVLVVRAYDGEGVAIDGPNVRVADGNGKSFTSYGQGVSWEPEPDDGARRVGPLPSGTYRVIVKPGKDSEHEAEQTVSVSGETERELRFDFDS